MDTRDLSEVTTDIAKSITVVNSEIKVIQRQLDAIDKRIEVMERIEKETNKSINTAFLLVFAVDVFDKDLGYPVRNFIKSIKLPFI